VGGIVPLPVTVNPSAAATLLTYTSSDPAIASVSGSAPLLQVQGVATEVVSISLKLTAMMRKRAGQGRGRGESSSCVKN
jgi:uncharacterized protein YjdB